MPNRNYDRGAEFENKVAEFFRSLGFSSCRVAGSHGIYDVVATRLPWVFLIQCKTGGAISSDGWNDLYHEARTHGAVPVLASKKPGMILLEQILAPCIPRKRGRSKTVLNLEELTIGTNLHKDSRSNDGTGEAGCAEVPEESSGYSPYPADQIGSGD